MSGEKSQGSYCEYKCLSVSRASMELIQELGGFSFRSIGCNLASLNFSLCAEIRYFLFEQAQVSCAALLYARISYDKGVFHDTILVVGMVSTVKQCLYRSHLLRCIVKPCSVCAPVTQSRRKCLLLGKEVGFKSKIWRNLI